ncbi:hypothetical protein XF35_39135 [Streptomyces platensis subsp. clarensis]|uniref:Uncharacterized protein n=1 Tax=Streptomyces showdoensis TaxID=68268 RepID=A0A2P2GKR4_STREW|nr:hypothetical protein [Streptomyces showdoensis]KKZ72096.1 hypothetical protein VO63_20170 [Streptomyces showdoensis]MCW7991073.1 hypothetical protein [Streptomyces platensis subsp. clarensis]
MSETARLLRAAQQVLHEHGLLDSDLGNFADPDGRLDIVAAIYRAATGTTPDCFINAPKIARQLIDANELVTDAIRWVSAVLPTYPSHDQGTGIDDHIEHLAFWVLEPDFFLDRCPNTSDAIGVLGRAAQTADACTDIPDLRPAA